MNAALPWILVFVYVVLALPFRAGRWIDRR